MSDDATLQSMYPSMFEKKVELEAPPANVAALREEQQDLAALYPSMAEGRYSNVKIHDDIELPPEVSRVRRAELANLFNDIGASHLDAGYAQAKIREYAKALPTDAQVAEMQRDAKTQLAGIYGKDAHQALMDAKKLATRDPRFAKLLSTTNLGNDPGFVVRMAAMARAERARGRLK